MTFLHSSLLGVALRFSVRGKQLVCMPSLSEDLIGKTAGLFGVFDGNETNDLMTPSGDILPPDSSEQDIFNEFGQKCKQYSVYM